MDSKGCSGNPGNINIKPCATRSENYGQLCREMILVGLLYDGIIGARPSSYTP